MEAVITDNTFIDECLFQVKTVIVTCHKHLK